jgi:hypothetical protein
VKGNGKAIFCKTLSNGFAYPGGGTRYERYPMFVFVLIRAQNFSN